MNNLDTVKTFISTHINKNEPIVLGLSGGLDSMVLFDILKKEDCKVIIAHINHKKRKESDDEYEAIKELADTSNTPFEGIALTGNFQENFHDEARQLRFDFFKQVAHKYQTKKVFLAHHLDDQVETFLMKFFKGSPLSNLAPIKAITQFDNITLYRPLLNEKKASLIAYAKNHNLTYYHDASNDSLVYTRNRYRHTIIPILNKEIPFLDDLVLSRLDQFEAMEALIHQESVKFINQNQLSIEAFNALNPLIKEAVLKQLINTHTKGTYDVSKALTTHLIHLLNSHESNLIYPIHDALSLHIEYDHFFIAKKHKKTSNILEINQVGTYVYDTCKTYVVTHEKSSHISSNCVVLWYNSKVFPLTIRTRMPKDKIHLSFGHKKIKDFMIDKKIPPSQRNEIVLLANDEEVLWIPFLNIRSESFKEGTKKVYLYEVCTC